MDGGMHLPRGSGDGRLVPFAVVNRPFGTRVETTAEWGLTIRQMMEASRISPSMQRRTKCFLVDPVSGSETLIYPEHWDKVRPKFGTEVVLRVFPGKGGGGKSILGIVLSIAIIAAAAWAGPALAGAIPALVGAGGVLTGGGLIVGGLLTAGIGMVGKMLISALIPPPKPPSLGGKTGGSSRADSPTYSINGTRNTLDPDGVVPELFGRFRVTPKYASRPYTEIVGSDQFIRAAFDFGTGPVDLTEIKIGETPLDQFVGVETDYHDRFDPSVRQLSLYVGNVFEEPLAIEVGNDGIRESAKPAEAVLHFSGNAANNDTVLIGDKTYTFKTTLGTAANQIKIGTTTADTIDNLVAAINRTGFGAGTLYTAATLPNTRDTASAISASAMRVVAIEAGDFENGRAIGETGANLSWENRVLFFGAAAGNGETVTIDGKVYTWQSSLTNVDGNVKVGATAAASRDNLVAAVNLGAGAGAVYAAATTAHPTARAANHFTDALGIAPLVSTHTLTTSETMASASWQHGQTAGGSDSVMADPWLEDENWLSQDTQPNAREFSVDITFQAGLYLISSSGAKQPQTARFDVRYRLASAVDPDPWTHLSTQSHAVLFLTGQPGDTQTVTIDGKVYTFQNTLTNVNGHVKIGVDIAASLANLAAAITLAAGAGTVYAAATTQHPTVTAVSAPSTLTATARTLGSTTGPDGDTIAVSDTLSNGSWTFTTLQGGADALSVTAKDASVRIGRKWDFPDPGQYRVQIRRITMNSTDVAVQDKSHWTALRSIFAGSPILKTGNTILEVRIKATDQLNGTLDTLNAVGQRKLKIPSWTGSAWVWSDYTATRNPAYAALEVLRGPGNKRPIADARIDLDAYLDWADACDTNDSDGDPLFRCDGVFDFRTTVYQALADICATGRATPDIDIRSGLHSIVRDVPQTVPVTMIGPHNSFGFKGTIVFPDPPHAWRAKFKDATNGWADKVRTIYFPGYDATNATDFEVIEMPMVTEPKQIWRDGSYLAAAAMLRPGTYQVSQDPEWMQARRGDLVSLAHDAMRVGLGTGRLKSVAVDGGGDGVGLTLNSEIQMETGKNYVLEIRRALDNAKMLISLLTVPGRWRSVEPLLPIDAAELPAPDDLFFFGLAGRATVEALVKSVEPDSGMNARLTLVDAAPAVHTADTEEIPPYDPGTTPLVPYYHRKPPKPVIAQVISDESVLTVNPDGSLTSAIVVLFGGLSNVDVQAGEVPAASVQAQYRYTGSEAARSNAPQVVASLGRITIAPVDDGEVYDLWIRSVSNTGEPSDYVTISAHRVIGKTTKPPGVANIRRDANGDVIWDYPNPPRDAGGFVAEKIAGIVVPFETDWSTGTALHSGVLSDGRISLDTLEPGTWTIMIRAIDRANPPLMSAEIAFITVTIGEPVFRNAELTDDISGGGFPGTIVNGSVISGVLTADSDAEFMFPEDPLATPFPDDPTADVFSATGKAMTYTDSFTPIPEAVGVPITIAMTVDVGTAAIEYSIDDGATYLPWPTSLRAEDRAYLIRVTAPAGPAPAEISVLQIIADLPDVDERIDDVAVSGSGSRLSLTKTYFLIDEVRLSIRYHVGETAMSYRIVDKNPTLGPLVELLDATGAVVAGHVDGYIHGARGV